MLARVRDILQGGCKLIENIPWEVVVLFNRFFLLTFLVWEAMRYADFWIFLVLKGFTEFGAVFVIIVITLWMWGLFAVTFIYFQFDFSKVNCKWGLIKPIINVVVFIFMVKFIIGRIEKFTQCLHKISSNEYEYKGRVGERTLYFMNCFVFAETYKVGGNWDCVTH